MNGTNNESDDKGDFQHLGYFRISISFDTFFQTIIYFTLMAFIQHQFIYHSFVQCKDLFHSDFTQIACTPPIWHDVCDTYDIWYKISLDVCVCFNLWNEPVLRFHMITTPKWFRSRCQPKIQFLFIFVFQVLFCAFLLFLSTSCRYSSIIQQKISIYLHL